MVTMLSLAGPAGRRRGCGRWDTERDYGRLH